MRTTTSSPCSFESVRRHAVTWSKLIHGRACFASDASTKPVKYGRGTRRPSPNLSPHIIRLWTSVVPALQTTVVGHPARLTLRTHQIGNRAFHPLVITLPDHPIRMAVLISIDPIRTMDIAH